MRSIRLQAALVLLLVLTVGGCGKKGDPFVPTKEFSAEVQGLSGVWDGMFIVLRGELKTASHGKGTRTEGVRGALVYYGSYDPDEPPCEGCPVMYQGYHEFGAEVVSGEVFNCRVPEKRKDALYFFKVHLVGPQGGVGPASQRVRVDPSES